MSISLRSTTTQEDVEKETYIVDWEYPSDPENPQAWSLTRKWIYTSIIASTVTVVSGAGAFSSETAPQAAAYFGVSEKVALLSTALFLIPFGLGSLISAPFSETVGRNPVYICCEYFCQLVELWR
jgi:hypothetical protein